MVQGSRFTVQKNGVHRIRFKGQWFRIKGSGDNGSEGKRVQDGAQDAKPEPARSLCSLRALWRIVLRSGRDIYHIERIEHKRDTSISHLSGQSPREAFALNFEP